MTKKKLSKTALAIKKQGVMSKQYTDLKAGAEKVYIIEAGTADTGYLKTYLFARGVNSENDVIASGNGANLIGKINIPKDFLVTGVKRVTVEAGTGANEGKWMVTKENGTAVTAYEAPSSVNAAGVWAIFTINVKSGSATDEYLTVNLSELIDVYTGGNGVDVTSNVITIDLDANGGLTFTGSTDGSKQLAIKLDSSNANGLALTSAGLKLALAQASTNGAGGSAGAMSAQDKENLDDLVEDTDVSLLTDAEIASWYGFDITGTPAEGSDAAAVKAALQAVSDDSITDEE